MVAMTSTVCHPEPAQRGEELVLSPSKEPRNCKLHALVSRTPRLQLRGLKARPLLRIRYGLPFESPASPAARAALRSRLGMTALGDASLGGKS